MIYENSTQKYLLTKAGYVSLNDNKYHYYLPDHQGNNRVVVDKDGNVEETNHYYPFGGLFASSSSVQPYKYNGKEYDSRKGLNWYDYGVRHYDAALGRWHVSDPSGEKYYPWSPYTYCLNNPAHLVDVTGKDVWVKVQSDGTYRIVGGTRNDDLNIYLVDAQGNRTDNVVGRTLTAYSFYSDKGKVIEGAVINPQDQTGQNFIDKEIIADNPNIMYYMPNAIGGKKYDFKTRGIKNRPIGMTMDQYKYRGMPFKDAGNDIAYASARDIGNYGAGYIAGRVGMNWKTARMGFDALESAQNRRLSSEGMTTQKAERMGYEAGASKNWLKKTNDWLKQLFNIPNKTPEAF